MFTKLSQFKCPSWGDFCAQMYGNNGVYKGSGWRQIILSALEHLQRENDKFGPINF